MYCEENQWEPKKRKPKHEVYNFFMCLFRLGIDKIPSVVARALLCLCLPSEYVPHGLQRLVRTKIKDLQKWLLPFFFTGQVKSRRSGPGDAIRPVMLEILLTLRLVRMSAS